MTTLTYNEHHLRMLQIITEREGSEMATAHEAEKTMIELENHFEANYTIFDLDTPPAEIIELALDDMGNRDFVAMLERNDFTDIFEMLSIEGFLTQVSNVWVVSLNYPWKGSEEHELPV